MRGALVNLTDLLDLLGALLMIAGAAFGVALLVGVWAALLAAGLLVIGLSALVGRLGKGGAE